MKALLSMCRTVLVIVLGTAVPVAAQIGYFGQNKVQYDRFDFSILQTPHFDVYYYAAEGDAARIAARLAERWYARLSATLHHTFDRRQPIILYSFDTDPTTMVRSAMPGRPAG